MQIVREYLHVVYLLSVLLCKVLSQQDNCDEATSPTCILPKLLSTSTAVDDLNSLLVEIRCTIGCIEKYGDASLEVIDSGKAWPTLDFEKYTGHCNNYPRIQGCWEGCLTRHRDQSATINRCRDICYSGCQEGGTCSLTDTCQDPLCPKFCRKTYCRFGCEVYDQTGGNSGNSSSILKYAPVPSTTPSLSVATNSSTTRSWLYSIDTENAHRIVQQRTSGTNWMYSHVAYIIKIVTPSSEHYVWQKNPSQLIDLSPFACSRVSVSFAVVSKYRETPSQHLQFSPILPVCIPGVGGYPAKLDANSFHITYAEDLREDFLGYAVANVSWSPPNNLRYLTSYTIRVYPDSDNCGGEDTIHRFNNINKNFTSFKFFASGTSGLWRFGCSYLIEVVSLPTETLIELTIGAYFLSTTELVEPFPPLELLCERVWDDQGHFVVSANWSFPEGTQTSHILRYIVTPTLRVGTKWNIARLYNSTSYGLQGEGQNFSILSQTFIPQRESSNTSYTIEVSMEKNRKYYWRRIPHTASCSIPASPLPPSIITNISMVTLEVNRTRETLFLVVDIAPPESYHGMLKGYELVLATSYSDLCMDCNDSQYLLSMNSTVRINYRFRVNRSSHCLYLKARALNHYNLSGPWHEKTIPLDANCVTNHHPSLSDSPFLSVVYEKTDGSRVKVVEFDCAIKINASSLLSHSAEDTLQAIDIQIQDITLRIQDMSQEDNTLVALSSNTELKKIKERMNRLLQTLSTMTES